MLLAIFFPPWTIPQTQWAIQRYSNLLYAEKKRDEEALKKRQDASLFLKTSQLNPLTPTKDPVRQQLRQAIEARQKEKQRTGSAPAIGITGGAAGGTVQNSTVTEFLKQRTTERERVIARVKARMAEQDRIRAIRTLLETGGIPADLQVSPEERSAASQEPLPAVPRVGRRIQHGFVFSPPVIGPLPVAIYTPMLLVEILGVLFAGGLAWLVVTFVASQKGENP